jgi:alpha-ribazole phosphatase
VNAAACIDLLRHGDTGQRSYRGQLDDPPTPAGFAQMRAAVVGHVWDAIVSSPQQRCAAFAHELASLRGLPLRLDARLAEYHFGAWQGVPIETLAAQQAGLLARFWADPVACSPPGAEAFEGFRARLCGALDDAADAGHARTLIVTHGGAIRLLRCVAGRRGFGDMAALEVPHASLHRVDWPVAALA